MWKYLILVSLTDTVWITVHVSWTCSSSCPVCVCVFNHALRFNMPHDDSNKCKEDGVKNQQHVMAPTLNYYTNPWMWSKCSRKYITEFLEYVNPFYTAYSDRLLLSLWCWLGLLKLSTTECLMSSFGIHLFSSKHSQLRRKQRHL